VNANEYQEKAARTLLENLPFKPTRQDLVLTWLALELAQRASAICERVKKQVWHQHGLNLNELQVMASDVGVLADNFVALRSADVPQEFTDRQVFLLWNALGLVGESGEVTDKILEAIVKGEAPDLKSELGDGDWYTNALATKTDLSFEEILAYNVAKLEKRYRKGYTAEESKARVDTRGNDV